MQESACSKAKSEYRQHKHGYMIPSDITNDKNEIIKYQKKINGKCERLIKTILSVCQNMYFEFFHILSKFCDFLMLGSHNL